MGKYKKCYHWTNSLVEEEEELRRQFTGQVQLSSKTLLLGVGVAALKAETGVDSDCDLLSTANALLAIEISAPSTGTLLSPMAGSKLLSYYIQTTQIVVAGSMIMPIFVISTRYCHISTCRFASNALEEDEYLMYSYLPKYQRKKWFAVVDNSSKTPAPSPKPESLLSNNKSFSVLSKPNKKRHIFACLQHPLYLQTMK